MKKRYMNEWSMLLQWRKRVMRRSSICESIQRSTLPMHVSILPNRGIEMPILPDCLQQAWFRSIATQSRVSWKRREMHTSLQGDI